MRGYRSYIVEIDGWQPLRAKVEVHFAPWEPGDERDAEDIAIKLAEDGHVEWEENGKIQVSGVEAIVVDCD